MLLLKRFCHHVLPFKLGYMRGIVTWPFLKAVKQLADAIYTLWVSIVLGCVEYNVNH